ncbi:MAG: hypothetical protein ACTSXK_13995 [Promethearchaeota archaeon]
MAVKITVDGGNNFKNISNSIFRFYIYPARNKCMKLLEFSSSKRFWIKFIQENKIKDIEALFILFLVNLKELEGIYSKTLKIFILKTSTLMKIPSYTQFSKKNFFKTKTEFEFSIENKKIKSKIMEFLGFNKNLPGRIFDLDFQKMGFENIFNKSNDNHPT